jgi:NitT/TauT family transport system substrate-binding protein
MKQATSKSSRRDWIAGLSSIGLVGLSTRADAQSAVTCRVIGAAPSIRIDQAFQFFGAQQGFFKRLGVTLDYTTVTGSELSCQLVAADKGDLCYVSPTTLLILKQQQPKLPLRVVYLHDVSNGYDVAVPPDSPIKTAADLKGKSVGVPSLASGSVPTVKAMARRAGIDPNTVTFVAVGTEAQAVTTLRTKQVDALSLFRGQFASIENTGFQLRYFPEVRLPNSAFLASEKGIRENKEAIVRGLQCALLNTVYMLASPESATRDFLEYHKTPGDQDKAYQDNLHLLKRTSALWQQIGTKRPWGAMTDTDWKSLVTFLGADAGINPDHIDYASLYTEEFIPAVNKVNTAIAYEAAKRGR